MADVKRCATCGHIIEEEEEKDEVEQPTPETPAEEGSADDGAQIKSFRLHRHSNDTEFAVLLALVPAMTMTLFHLMGLL